MFESGGTTADTGRLIVSPRTVNTTASSTEDDIDGSQYVLVFFVITIVVVSSLYFFLALLGELSRSFSHFCKVTRSRKSDKKKGTKTKGKKRGTFDDATFSHNVNPLHSASARSASQESVATMQRFK